MIWRGRQLAFDLLDAAFDKALAVLGGFVFGVFAQIALGTRFGDGVDDPGRSTVLSLCNSALSFSAPRLVMGMVAT